MDWSSTTLLHVQIYLHSIPQTLNVYLQLSCSCIFSHAYISTLEYTPCLSYNKSKNIFLTIEIEWEVSLISWPPIRLVLILPNKQICYYYWCKQSWWILISSTRGERYNDTSLYKVSECSKHWMFNALACGETIEPFLQHFIKYAEKCFIQKYKKQFFTKNWKGVFFADRHEWKFCPKSYFFLKKSVKN